MKIWKWLKRFILQLLVGGAVVAVGYGGYKGVLFIISKLDVIKKYGIYALLGICTIVGLELIGWLTILAFGKIKSKIRKDKYGESQLDTPYCEEAKSYSKNQFYDENQVYDDEEYADEAHYEQYYEQTEG